MQNEIDIIRDVSARLERENIAYMLTGSMAMNYYAQPRMTRDKVGCIVRKQSPYRRAEFERRRRIAIEDFSTWIVSKEDLIISKLDWAKDSRSELQLRDVKNLAATGYDEEYVDRWTTTLGLSELWRECQT